MSGVALPRILLGPQSEGRNHGVLARSAGSDLSGAAESALRDYHLRIGDYLADPAPIYALFELPDGAAAACVTTRHGEVRGNRVWATSAVLLTDSQRRTLKPLLGAFAPVSDHGPLPDPGTELSPWTPVRGPDAGPWPPGQLQEIAAALAPDAPLAVEVSAPQTVLGLLAGLLPSLKAWQRRRLSFVSAPAPLAPWMLVAYQAEAWDAAEALNRSYRLVRLGGGRAAGADGAAAAVWSQLLHALGDDDLAETLFLAADGIGVADEPPAGLVRDRAAAGLAALPTDAARRESFGRLITAAMSLKPDARRPAVAGLYDAFERLAVDSQTPQAWIEDYLSRLAPLTAAEPQAPLFIGRVALQSGALFRLPPARIAELAPLLVSQAAEAVRSALIRRGESGGDARLWPAIDLILLQEALKSAENTPERDEIWRLSTRLSRLLAASTQPPVGAAAALAGFLGLCLRHGRDAEYAALLSAATLPGLVRIVSAERLRGLLIGPIRMVREELEQYPDQTPTRDLVIYALCLRRAGALAREAA